LTALERGLTPDTVRNDAPINIRGWRPEDYERQYLGPVTLTRALALSLNTVAVRVGLEVGPGAVIKTAHRLGITSDLQANASIALGTSEVTPLELVTAYVPFANGGVGVEPYVITKIRTARGKLLFKHEEEDYPRVIEPEYVAMMNSMLRETLVSGTARRAELPGWDAAGKTGTSQDFRDAWFVGYTSRLVAGVWLGNDDNAPTKKASGGSLPVEIWSKFMRVAHEDLSPQPLPGGTWSAPQTQSIPIASDIFNFLTGQDHANPAHERAGPPIALGQAPMHVAPRTARREDNGLVPPASIPNGQAADQNKPFFGLF